MAWGSNRYGQCDVPNPNTGFMAVAAGYYHSLGLKADGSVVVWGRTSAGQDHVPQPNSGFVAIAGGSAHRFALRARSSTCPGDANCDGLVTWRDIDFFLTAMNDNAALWGAEFLPGTPRCLYANNDVDGDGNVTWRDIAPFVGLMNTTCP